MKNTRNSIGKNDEMDLFGETNGICPLCSNALIKKKSKNKTRIFEIAHIYPLNPTESEKSLLQNESLLSDDANDPMNLICLCVECHTKFDNPRTIDEYRELCNIKTRINREYSNRKLWRENNLESEILQIIDELNDFDFNQQNDIEINYNIKTIDEKTNDTLSKPTRRKIKLNVQDYYPLINQKLKSIDQLSPGSSEIISLQIRTLYVKLCQKHKEINQQDIFMALVAWMTTVTNQNSNDPAEIIISYFVQNCEVF